MARPIDREKYEVRRAVIVDAASEQFATHGYQRATTAGICRAAGISSGTFFHYFPTKLDALVAVLDSGCDDLVGLFARIEQQASGLDAVLLYAVALESELSADSYPVFVAGLAGFEAEPRVAAALSREAELITAFLTRTVQSGRHTGTIRHDASVTDLARWTSWLLDGAAQAAATPSTPQPTDVSAALHTLLAPIR